MAFLCWLEQLPDGQSRGFDAHGGGQDTLLAVRQGELVFAYLNACPHYGNTPLAWRKDEYLNAARDRIVCAAHGAQFDIPSGLCTLGPCLGQSLTPVPLTVMPSGAIHIHLDKILETST